MNIPIWIIMALIAVESGGNNQAIGRNAAGQPVEYGCLQITKACVEDVNRILGAEIYSFPKDCLDRGKSVEMLKIYLGHYATKERLGREPDIQDLARIWNGGPDGYKEPETKDYWRKVGKVLRYNARPGWERVVLPPEFELAIR